MRLTFTAAILVCHALLFGCSLNSSRDPGFRALDQGKIFTYKAKSKESLDNYELTYVVKKPLERAWQCSSQFIDWLEQSEYVTSIDPVEDFEPLLTDSDDITESRWWIQFRGSDVGRQFVLLRNDDLKTFEIRLVTANRDPRQLNRCTVRMRPFLVGSTLVEAKLQVRSDFLRDLVSIVTSLAGDAADAKVIEFGEAMAEAHRRPDCPPPPPARPSDRIHIISIGVNAVSDPDAQAGFGLAPARFAENDAERFYEWACAFFPRGDPADPPIRIKLIGETATAGAIKARLTALESHDGGNVIRPDDTIVLFLAGQVKSVRSPGRGTSSPHFLAWNADPAAIDLTTINCLEILESLRASPASSCIFFSDACFIGGSRAFTVDELESDFEAGHPPPKAEEIGARTALFTAEMLFRDAAESGAVQHGVFTYRLLEKLRTIRPGGQISLTLVDLGEYILSAVAEDTGNRQHPFVYVSKVLQDCRIEADGRIECSVSH
jgi:hypothetical protein